MLEKWDNYEAGNVKFIDHNREHLYHEVFIDFIKDNPDIGSVLEVGPGEMVEYPEIKKIRPLINFTVLETSIPFIEFINKNYPDVTIMKGTIEHFNYTPVEYDLVRVCDVIEHTYPLYKTIKNLVNCAKLFHITMFKWVTGPLSGGVSPGLWSSQVRRDSTGVRYFSSEFPIMDVITEIKKYGTIDSLKIINQSTGEIIDFDDYWLKNFKSVSVPEKSERGLRLVITGRKL